MAEKSGLGREEDYIKSDRTNSPPPVLSIARGDITAGRNPWLL